MRKKEEETRPEATAQTIKDGLSRLGKTANGIKQTYLDLKVEGTLLADASLIAKYVNLQSVDVQRNEITDLSALSALRHLTHLDASHNKLTQVVPLDPPTRNLRSLHLAHNNIIHIADISAYQRLSKLVLDGNQITDLSGLGSLPHLKALSVQDNRLATLEGLQKCSGLRRLSLSRNELTSLEPLHSMSHIESLEVAGNKLSSLKGVESITCLARLDCSDNLITELEEIRYAQPLDLLKELTVTGNAIVNFKLSRVHIVHLIPQLEGLNGEGVSFTEKVKAGNLHGADAEPLKTIRRKYFPNGELDDGGGAVIPVSAGLLASNGLDAKDDEIFFEAADEAVRTLSHDLLLEGLDKFGDFLMRTQPSQLALARACWTWVLINAADPPSVPWQGTVPALRPSAAAVEEKLLPEGEQGTYAEKLATIFVMLCRSCQLEVTDILGYWKTDTMLPGSRLQTHNHCWNAVKVNGRWRLFDLFWAVRSVRSGVEIPFYVSPEAFIYSHLPLEEWWQLLGTYISAKQFWELPFCTLTFFTSGLYFTDDQLSAVTTVDVEPYRKPRVGEFPALPVVELLLEHPEGEFVTHELLDGNLEPLYPPVQPGSYVFTQLHSRSAGERAVSSPDHAARASGTRPVAQKLWTSFPGPGDFFVRVSLANGTQVMMLRYVLPEGAPGSPVKFPDQAPEFLRLGCELLMPVMTTILQGDMTYEWQARVPTATKVDVGDDTEPSGFWTSLSRDSAELFSGTLSIPRTPKTSLKATFETGQEITLLTYSVRPPVQQLDALPAEPAATNPSPAGKLAAGRAAFYKMDRDRDGLISRAELAVGLHSIPDLPSLVGLSVEASSPGPRAESYRELVVSLNCDTKGKIAWPSLAAKIEEAAQEPPIVQLECSSELDGTFHVTLSEVDLEKAGGVGGGGEADNRPLVVQLECTTSDLDDSVKVVLSPVGP